MRLISTHRLTYLSTTVSGPIHWQGLSIDDPSLGCSLVSHITLSWRVIHYLLLFQRAALIRFLKKAFLICDANIYRWVDHLYDSHISSIYAEEKRMMATHCSIPRLTKLNKFVCFSVTGSKEGCLSGDKLWPLSMVLEVSRCG